MRAKQHRQDTPYDSLYQYGRLPITEDLLLLPSSNTLAMVAPTIGNRWAKATLGGTTNVPRMTVLKCIARSFPPIKLDGNRLPRMRFHIGPIPEPKSSDLPPGEWTPLRHDFGPLVMQLFAWPIGCAAFVIVGWLWLHETHVMKHLGNPTTLLVGLIIAMLALIPIHEFLHTITHPDFGMSGKTVVGAWPSRLLFYAHYDGPRSRERLIVCIAMPFLIMTVAPLLIALITGHAFIIFAFVSTLNALASGADIFNIGILLWQVPRRTNVFNQGWRTYWSQPVSG